MRLTPAVRISFGLVSLIVSFLLLGQLLGLAPDRNKGVLESSKNFSEFVAVQFFAAAGRGDYSLIRETLRSMVERDNDINILSGFKNSYLGLILFVSCSGFAGY